MASKQQISSNTSQQTIQSFVFLNVEFNGDDKSLLRGLRANYSGIEKALNLHQKEGNEQFIHAIQIDVKSDKAAEQFRDQSQLYIFNKQYSIQTLPRSLFVVRIASNEAVPQIMQDLTHNYLGIERIHRLYNLDDQPIDCIRIDFKSDASVSKILKDKYIFIGGKRRSIQPCWSCTLVPEENSNKPPVVASQQSIASKPMNGNSRKYLTERRVQELFHQQQMRLKEMIDQFEKKWETRLASIRNSSQNAHVDQLNMVIRELSTVCQQFSQQNTQIQRQLGAIAHQVQDTQMKITGEQIPVQNGH